MSTNYAGTDSFPDEVAIPGSGDERAAASVNVPLEGALDRTVYNRARALEKVPKFGAPGGRAQLNLLDSDGGAMSVPAGVNLLTIESVITANKNVTLNDADSAPGDEILFINRHTAAHGFTVTFFSSGNPIGYSAAKTGHQTWMRFGYFAAISGFCAAGWYVTGYGPHTNDSNDIRDFQL